MGSEQMGHRLRQLRCMAGLEQADLAPLLGFKTATGVSYLESGKRRITAAHIDALATYYSRVLAEEPEDVIAFIHGSRRWSLAAGSAPIYKDTTSAPELRDVGGKTFSPEQAVAPDEASMGYFPFVLSDLLIDVSDAA